jgi:hypothetical protein
MSDSKSRSTIHQGECYLSQKRDGFGLLVQRDVISTAEDELASRVRQWIKDSKPPRLCTRFRGQPISEDFLANILEDEAKEDYDACILEHEANAAQKISSSDIALYHPDFADWSSVKMANAQRSSSARPSPFKALDDATASISNLFRVSFDRQA